MKKEIEIKFFETEKQNFSHQHTSLDAVVLPEPSQIKDTSSKHFLTDAKRNKRQNISTSILDSKTRSPRTIKISRVPKKHA